MRTMPDFTREMDVIFSEDEEDENEDE